MHKATARKEICFEYEPGTECKPVDGVQKGTLRQPDVGSDDHDHESISSEAPRWITASVSYMVAHINEPLRVSTLMEMAGLSSSQFFTLFKRATGQAPLEFFIAVKMSRARELLSSTKLTVKEIASILGYDDQFYFSRRFKLVNGMSPKAFRAMINGGKRLDIAAAALQSNPWARLPSPIALAEAPLGKWAAPRQCVTS
jgi:AraC-like DNA-binding protein